MPVILLEAEYKNLRKSTLLILKIEKNLTFRRNSQSLKLLSRLILPYHRVFLAGSYLQNLDLKGQNGRSLNKHLKVCYDLSFLREMSLFNHITLNINKLISRPNLSCIILRWEKNPNKLIARFSPWVMYSNYELFRVFSMDRAIWDGIILRSYKLQQSCWRWVSFQIYTCKIWHFLCYRLLVTKDRFGLRLEKLWLVVESYILSCGTCDTIVMLDNT